VICSHSSGVLAYFDPYWPTDTLKKSKIERPGKPRERHCSSIEGGID
jgi:hypothetical protein